MGTCATDSASLGYGELHLFAGLLFALGLLGRMDYIDSLRHPLLVRQPELCAAALARENNVDSHLVSRQSNLRAASRRAWRAIGVKNEKDLIVDAAHGVRAATIEV